MGAAKVGAERDRTYLALQLDLLVIAIGDIPLRQARLTPGNPCQLLSQISSPYSIKGLSLAILD